MDKRRTATAREKFAHGKRGKNHRIDLERWEASYNYAERNAILAELGFKSYREYLKSPLWKSIRSEAIKRDCLCCRKPATQVHHRKYTVESLTKVTPDLVSVCGACHQEIEFFRKMKVLAPKKRKLGGKPSGNKLLNRLRKKGTPAPLPNDKCAAGGGGLKSVMKSKN